MAGNNSKQSIIAFCSAMSGAGKSSIAVNLGLSIAKTDAQVLLLDAGSGDTNAAYLLGVSQQSRESFSVDNDSPQEKFPLQSRLKQVGKNFSILSCAKYLHHLNKGTVSQQQQVVVDLQNIESIQDYILIDAELSDEGGATFIEMAHHVVFILTCDEAAISETLVMISTNIDLFRKKNLLVIVNKVAFNGQAREAFLQFSTELNNELGLSCRLLGIVNNDESLNTAATLQSPVALFSDHDPSARRFDRLSDDLLDAVRNIPSTKSMSQHWAEQWYETPSHNNALPQPDVAKIQVDKIKPATTVDRQLQESISPADLLATMQEPQQSMGEFISAIESGYFKREELMAIANTAAIQSVQQFGRSAINLDRYINLLFNQGGSIEQESLRELYVMLHSRFAHNNELEQTIASPNPSPQQELQLDESASQQAPATAHRLDKTKFNSEEEMLASLRQALERGQSLFDWLEE